MALSKEEKERRKEQRKVDKWNKEHRIIDGIDHKICKDCNEYFPSTIEYFYPNESNGTDGLSPICKKCSLQRSYKWRIKNRDKYLECLRRMNQRPEHKENIKERKRIYREQGREREWQQNNPDKMKKYREKRKIKDHTITKEEWESCKNYFYNSCAYCGLPAEEHVIIRMGVPTVYQLHKEHVDDEGCSDLENCVPACQSCNSSKHTFKLDEWYNEENENYTKERYDKIIKWIEEDHKQYIQPPKPKGKYTKNPDNPRWKNCL